LYRRDGLPGRGQQQGEERSLASSAERQLRTVGQSLDLAEDAEVGWAVGRLLHLSARFGHRNHDAVPASRPAEWQPEQGRMSSTLWSEAWYRTGSFILSTRAGGILAHR
jgi:hypothetical protein